MGDARVPVSRQRWTDQRRKKERSLYDEWLAEEKAEREQAQKPREASSPASTPLRHGDTAAALRESAGTVRAVTPDEASSPGASASQTFATERGTTSFERAYIPTGDSAALATAMTSAGGQTTVASAGSGSAVKSRRLLREREWEGETRNGQSGSGSGTKQDVRPPHLTRTSSRSNGQHSHAAVIAARDAQVPNTVRPRTRTLEERSWRERSPTSVLKSRNRMGSVHSPTSPIYHAVDYLASVPAGISPGPAPSVSSLGSPVQSPAEVVGRRSISPISSDTSSSMTGGLPTAVARRIAHLMKTLNGAMSGNVLYRRGSNTTWCPGYCYVSETTGSLMYESRSGDGAHKTLISDLAGCSVRANTEQDVPYLTVSLPRVESEVHFKLATQPDFDTWFATFLWWQSKELHLTPTASSTSTSTSSHRTDYINHNQKSPTTLRPASSSSHQPSSRPAPPPRTSSARQRERPASSGKSDRRKSVNVATVLREMPVIKIGKMIIYDTNIGYSSSNANATGPLINGRPQAHRMQSHGSRRWRRISGQLRESGELKLHSDVDNSLISVVQLSQLSRCAIQRLCPSVLDNDFCIAIYPQYTAIQNDSQTSFLRPIFLSLENRVLHEVWYVLLRAFTVPQLYGPPGELDNSSQTTLDADGAFASQNMFRVERSIGIRIVEAKMYPQTSLPPTADASFSGGHASRSTKVTKEEHAYYAEILLDGETRAKTSVKTDGLNGQNPLWGENFDFPDLPPVLESASVVIKRRPPDSAHARETHESKLMHEAYGFTSDKHGGFTGPTYDVVCGKVDLIMPELDQNKEVEKYWPVLNVHGQRVGDVLIKARVEDGIILMARDYAPLGAVLERFSNGVTLQIAQILPNELKRLSDCLLNIFQVSGKAGDWLMALVEEEIDGIHKETPISRLRYSSRIGSNDSGDHGASHSEREILVRDLSKNATSEANLLFRGNTLLTKSLDTHMRRVGKEYLEASLGAALEAISARDADCEVDPNKVHSQQDLDRNWKRLRTYTEDIWRAICAAKHLCPVELRVIFRHIRACAEDRYGEFLRTVSYSSVSGFLFLRFFCPAVLNPKMFGLLREDCKPRTRRTFTLIAKVLQSLANLGQLGLKEHWMEPMNVFLSQHRESFKTFIDDICYVPSPLTNAKHTGSTASSPTYMPGVVSAEAHLAYTTPITIMQRLPPTSREGFPSLPYLIDHARAYADLVTLWLEATNPSSAAHAETATTMTNKRLSDVMQAINTSEGDLQAFHRICTDLSRRTDECLNRAERAERPTSEIEFHWDSLIGQLDRANKTESIDDDSPGKSSLDTLADVVASDPGISDPSLLPPGMINSLDATNKSSGRSREWDAVTTMSATTSDDDAHEATRMCNPSPPPTANRYETTRAPHRIEHRGSTSVGSSVGGSFRRILTSRNSDHSANASNMSSVVSSDTEHHSHLNNHSNGATTALPNYEREVRHRERRDAAKRSIEQEVLDMKLRDSAKSKAKEVNGKTRDKETNGESSSRRKMPLAALRPRKKDRDLAGGA